MSVGAALVAIGQQVIQLELAASALPWPLGLGGGQEWGRQWLVEAESVLHPLPLAGEGLGVVAHMHHFSDTALNTPSSCTSVHSRSGLYSLIPPAIRGVFSPKLR